MRKILVGAAGLSLGALLVFPAASAFAVPTGGSDLAGIPPQELSQTSLRVATIEANLTADTPGKLNENLMGAGNPQASHAADSIAQANADVLVLTNMDADQAAVDTFREQYLNNTEDDRPEVDYKFTYLAVGSKGLQSGADLNADGVIGDAADAWGQGAYEEQGSIVVLSKYPIDEDQIASVSKLKWQDVANNQLHHTKLDGVLAASMPVMNTGMWDIPIEYRNQRVHVLATQTEPDQQDEDLAAARQGDELKVVADYIAGKKYVRTDDDDPAMGIGEEKFVLAGALNLQASGESRVDSFLKGLGREDALNDAGSYLVPDSSWQVVGQGRLEHSEPPLDEAIPEIVEEPGTLIWTDIEF